MYKSKEKEIFLLVDWIYFCFLDSEIQSVNLKIKTFVFWYFVEDLKLNRFFIAETDSKIVFRNILYYFEYKILDFNTILI